MTVTAVAEPVTRTPDRERSSEMRGAKGVHTVTGPDVALDTVRRGHQILERVERRLGSGTPGMGELHAAVEGTMELTTTLAELVATMIRQVPATFGGADDPVAKDLVADLRAAHGCLTTGALLLAPAREDLQRLCAPGRATNTAANGEATT
jgi:hypothetical protein